MLSENDKVKFLAALPELVEFARVQDSKLTKREVKEFFEDIALTKEHYDQIYAYLLANQIQVEDVTASAKDVKKYEQRAEQYAKSSVGKGEQGDGKGRKEASEEKSPYLQMYLRELKLIERCNEGEELDLYARLLKGEEEARRRLSEAKLHRVLEIVREYVDDGMVTEDLVQEGNMGLMLALSELFDRGTHEDCAGMIDDYIRQSVALAADEQIEVKEKEQRILAKLNLVHEAARVLAEEMGRLATLEELVEYTRLPLEEVEDIVNLSEGGIDVGSGDVRPDLGDEGKAGTITWDFKER
jgi:RNA polymerase primary sigma factor